MHKVGTTMKQQTIPANGDKACSCCQRFHRKLANLGGYWLGASCAEQYTFYCRDKDITSSLWRGYEKQYAKVKRMVEGE